MCHAAEFLASNSASPVPASAAWVDSSIGFADSTLVVYSGGPMTGRGTEYSCSDWTSSSSGLRSSNVFPSGGVGYDTNCASARPIACCNGASRTKHRGFTTATTTGAIPNGRSGAHAMCAQKFPGSHFCHASEYIRANSTLVTPPGGAWIDGSVNGATIAYGGSPLFGRGQANSCNDWTNGSIGNNSTVLRGDGSVGTEFSPACPTVRPLACCE